MNGVMGLDIFFNLWGFRILYGMIGIVEVFFFEFHLQFSFFEFEESDLFFRDLKQSAVEIKGRNGFLSGLAIFFDRVIVGIERLFIIRIWFRILLGQLGIEVLEILNLLELLFPLSDHFLMIFGEQGQGLNDFGMKVLFILFDFEILDDVLGNFRATVVPHFWLKFISELQYLLFEFLCILEDMAILGFGFG